MISSKLALSTSQIFRVAYIRNLSSISAIRAVVILNISLGLGLVSMNANSAYNTESMDSSEKNAYYCQGLGEEKKHSRYTSDNRQLIECMLIELAQYRQNELTALQHYFSYKVQGWLNYATYQDSSNHRPQSVKSSIQKAHYILEALRSGQESGLSIMDTTENAIKVAPELSANLSALKEQGAIELSPRELALGEVAIIWGAQEQCNRGWRKSSPTFRMADRWIRQAHQAYINSKGEQSLESEALQQSIEYHLKLYQSKATETNTC